MAVRGTARRRRALVLGLLAAVAAGAGAGAAIGFSGSHGRVVRRLGVTVPPAKLAPVEHAQPRTAPESTVPAPVPTAAIAPMPATLSAAGDVQVPLSPQLIRVRNVWLVGNGRTLVAVYAGAAGDDARNGRLVIVRQNLLAGTQTQRVVTVRGSGSVALEQAPLGAAVETSAQTATLRFRAADGRTGSLDLKEGRAVLR